MKKFLIPIFVMFVLCSICYSYSKTPKCSSYLEAEELVSSLNNKLEIVYTEVRKCNNCQNNTAIYNYYTANYNWSINEYEDAFFVGKCEECNYLEIGHEGFDLINGTKKHKQEYLYKGVK